MRFGSLFSGIGGLDLGLERAGMECAWQVEINDYCKRVLAKHWPDVQRYSDIRDCGRHNLAPVDLIAGGFPCQDISNAGNRAGIEGQQSGLWSEYHRIICELRPRFVLVENVAALLIRGVERVLGDLASCGYDAEWRVFQTSEFGGIHIRERLFIVAYPNNIGRQRQKLLLQGRLGSGWGAGFGAREQEWASFRNRQTLTEALRGHLSTPVICRMDDGIPNRLERTIALGNAVVPQISEWIARRILSA